MDFTYQDRLSDSPYIEDVAYVRADTDISPLCRADGRWELIVKRYHGQNNLLVAGPMSKASVATNAEDSEFIVVKFKLGTYMPCFPVKKYIDGEFALPEASNKSVWLNGSAWQLFDYDNVETFIDRLVRDGALLWDSVIKTALQDQPQDVPFRTVRHRFMHVTGMTQSTIRQIERARRAAELLERGVSILDVVYQLGYADQPHMTRALKHFIGQTPAQMIAMMEPG